MKKVNLNGLIEIMETKEDGIRIDYLWDNSKDPIITNLSYAKDMDEALKNALINLAIEYRKLREFQDEIDEIMRFANSHDFDKKYKELKKPTIDEGFFITMGKDV